jgi:tetratricopeptide (TPR) repeat protein
MKSGTGNAGRLGLRARLVCASLLLSAGAAVAQTRTEPVPPERVKAVEPSVVRVTTAKGTGSGFLVRADGLVVTAFHVVAGAATVYVHFPSGETAEIEGLASYRPERDVAVLKIKRERIPAASPLVPMAGGEPEPDSPLAAMGYPGGKALTVSLGIALRETRRDAAHPLAMGADVRGGQSGGPVLNRSGQAIGVIISRLGNELGFASQIDNVLPLPAEGEALTSMADANRSIEGAAWEHYSQALGILDFWKNREGDAAGAASGFEFARQRFAEAARKQPRFLQALVNAGLCSTYLEQYPAAIIYFQRALQAAPGSIAARYFLAFAHASNGDLDKAKSEARTVVSNSPAFLPARRALASFHAFLREYPSAIRELRSVLAVRPDDTRALQALGESLGATGQHEQAAAQYRKLTELEKENAEAHRGLGEAYSSLKRYREAEQALKTSVRLDPEDAKAQYVLGVVYLRQGNRPDARRVLTTLQKLDPERAARLKVLLES